MYSSIKRVVICSLPQRLRNQLEPGLRFILKWLYYGKRHHCPCCNSSIRKFVINDSICPACGSGKRHRFQWLILDREYGLFRTAKSVLDIAPMRFFQDHCVRKTELKYRSADLDSDIAMEKFDLTTTPYCDAEFDFILCSHVLEHIQDDRKAISEMHRILKPGGAAIIQVPLQDEPNYENPEINSPEARLIHFGQSDHMRIYGPDIKDRFDALGFQIQIKNCYAMFTEDEIDLFGLDKTEILFVGNKQR